MQDEASSHLLSHVSCRSPSCLVPECSDEGSPAGNVVSVRVGVAIGIERLARVTREPTLRVVDAVLLVHGVGLVGVGQHLCLS